MTRTKAIGVAAWLSMIFAVPLAFAQGYTPTTDTWQFALTPYYWGQGIDGTVQVQGTSGKADYSWFDEVNPADNFATEIHFEAKKNDLAFIVEPTYTNAEDTSAKVGSSGADVKVEYLLNDLLVGYRFKKSWEVLAGLRFASMDNTVQPDGGARSADSEDWVDLVGGVRYTHQLSEKWDFLGRFDIAGLDLTSGSDLTWNGSALFFWSFAPNSSLAVGYRILDIDFTTGSGSNRFDYDTRQQGPLIGVNFRWPRR
jgi:hypothetical protein